MLSKLKKKIRGRALTAVLLAICMVIVITGTVTCSAAEKYTAANATIVKFSDSGITAGGSYDGYEIDGTSFTITEAGTYVFSGSCSDGNIEVKKELTGVTVVLDGLKLTSSTTAPVNAKSDTDVTIVLAEGSDNTLTDADRDEEKPKSCLNSSGDLTITGDGSLTVTGNNKQGIKADGTLTITGGDITVSALRKALKADEKIVIGAKGGADSDLNITIASSYEGIESENVYFYSGTIDITSDDDGVNSVSSDDETTTETTTETDESSSSAAADTKPAASATDAAGSGSGSAPSADGAQAPPAAPNAPADGAAPAAPNAPADGAAPAAPSGGGDRPDGFNGGDRQPGGESMPEVGDYNIYISGGHITIDAGGDALDSNGSIYMTGGTVEAYQTGSGDSAIDYETACEVTGGTLLAAGMAGMTETPTQTDDSQPYVNFTVSSSLTSGSTISIKDESGTTVYTTKLPESVRSVIFSSADLTSGSSYTLYEGGMEKGSAEATTERGTGGQGGGQGMMQPGGGRGDRQDGQDAQKVGSFNDVLRSSWYASAVEYITGQNLMSGTSSSSFDPDGSMTRAMLVTVLWRAEGKPSASADPAFTDVADDSWYSEAAAWAAENGIVEGTSENEFSPDRNITRQEIATILKRYAEYKGQDVSDTGDLSTYTDSSSVASWASDAMGWAVESGVITGATSSTLEPSSNATRAQAATMIMRYMQAQTESE